MQHSAHVYKLLSFSDPTQRCAAGKTQCSAVLEGVKHNLSMRTSTGDLTPHDMLMLSTMQSWHHGAYNTWTF